MGGSLSDWSWLKAFLRISLGGWGTRWISLYTRAAFLASLDQSKKLGSGILGYSPQASGHTMPALQALISGTGSNDWFSFDNVDFPLQQCTLSKVINQASFHHTFLSKLLTLVGWP